MINLAIDRGNSAIKTGVFDNNNLVATYFIKNDINKITEILNIYHFDNVIISSVVKNDEFNIKSIIEEFVENVIILDHNTPLPFYNHYNTPETLGKDRVAAIAGAQVIFPGENVLVIDAGTAITYDIIINGNDYLGGDIAPGLEMRFKALHHFTSRLPLLSSKQNISFPGKNTNEAISSGSINGMVFEIEGYMNFCNEKYNPVKTIITGGDADFFVKELKKPIFVDQNLVLKGLNQIIKYNTDN